MAPALSIYWWCEQDDKAKAALKLSLVLLIIGAAIVVVAWSQGAFNGDKTKFVSDDNN